MWVLDLEQFPNFHSCCAVNLKTDERVEFVLHESRNDLEEYLEWIDNLDTIITYNGQRYDYPLMYKLYDNAQLFENGMMSTETLYEESQRLIDNDVSPLDKMIFNPHCENIDIFLILGYNNAARRTSLKKLQFMIDWKKMQDLPFDPHQPVSEVDDIIEYNWNDVESTRAVFEHKEFQEALEFNREQKEKHNLRSLNFSNIKLGEKVITKALCEKLDASKEDLYPSSTDDTVSLDDVVFDYINFRDARLKELKGQIEQTTVSSTSDDFFKDLTVQFGGVEYVLGAGGLHGATHTGLYETDEEYVIKEIDAKSYYPNLNIQNDSYPKHLGEGFCDVYENMYRQRLKAQSRGDDTGSAAYKLACNVVFGKSKDQYSIFHDLHFFFRTTINGQLLLLAACEDFNVCGDIIYANTDGICVRVPKSRLEEFNGYVKKWENMTHIPLDQVVYDKIYLKDVNNYLAIYEDGSIKEKGCFERQKPWHKNDSQRIVRKAIKRHLVDGIPLENTIRDPDNSIFDYCLLKQARRTAKSEKPWYFALRWLEGNELKEQRLQKTIRFFVSLDGKELKKLNPDGREQSIVKRRKVTIFNDYYHKDNYNIDYEYYISEARKIVMLFNQKLI